MPLPYRQISGVQTRTNGLGSLGNGFPADMSLMDAYRWLQSECAARLGEDVCAAFLPEQPIWLPPTYKTDLPWYVWLLAGFIIGKIIL